MSNNPWGGGNNNRPGHNNSSNLPPDFEEVIGQLKDKMNKTLPPGGGNKFVISLFAIALIVAWFITGFYRVRTGEQAVVLRFGEYNQTKTSGLRYNLPYPIEQAVIVDMEKNRNVEVGSQVSNNHQRYGGYAPHSSRQMLTGDENILNIDFDVRWKVSSARDYLFKVNDPEQTVRAVSESVMREVVGRNKIDAILTEQRDVIEAKAKEEIQKTLDEYQAGVRILQVAINEALPPEEVIKDFKDVQAARADRERAVEEANAYKNKILPAARGEAVQMREKASAYKERVIAEAEGDVSRYGKIYEQYSRAPEVTKKRIYLETMEKLLAHKNKLIISKGANKTGVLPYLRLDDLSNKGSR